ncbi:hypothetical protein R1sor_006661 [Riccia sorocarpa]|uniref:RRM domain-containing protein n=1 Tax=Riccia sorocarpa TaxID=122646 RepID=A0ABD3HRW9_9MARC
MSHFGRAGPPDIRDTYSLLVLNITFRTSADDLFPLFDRYGKVVDIFIPRDRRTGESRGFAFVRYKYADEAQKAIDRLDGRNVDGREIAVQYAKYGPNAEAIARGRITEGSPRGRDSRSRSRSPVRSSRGRYRDSNSDRDYRSRGGYDDRYERDRTREPERERYNRRHRRHRSPTPSPSVSPSRSRSRSRGRDNDMEKRRSRTRSPVRSPAAKSRSTSKRRSRTPDSRRASPNKRSPGRGSVSPQRRSESPSRRSPSPTRDSPSGEIMNQDQEDTVERRNSPEADDVSPQKNGRGNVG